MEILKKIARRNFENFVYFYHHLRHRVFVAVILNIAVGILDGFGLAMFLPLLQMVDGKGSASADDMGNLGFLVSWLGYWGIELTLLLVLVIITVFFIFKGFATYFKEAYRVEVQQYFIKKIRVTNIDNLKNLAYKYFVTSDVGRIQNTMTGEVDRVARAYQMYFLSIQHAVMVAVYMGFAFLVDPKFAILVSIGGGVTNFVYKKIYASTVKESRKLTSDSNVFQGLIIQAVGNFKYLKATGQLQPYSNNLKNQVENIENSNRRIGILGAIVGSVREPLTVFIVCVVILIQTTLLDSPLAAILISLLFFYRALNNLMQMQAAWNNFLGVSGSLENMTDFSSELRSNKEHKGKEIFPRFSDSIKLEKANFRYGDTTILSNVDLEIKKNETIAFVGESGSGKTTLVNIVAGLVPIDDGKLTFDSISRNVINIESFQKRIGYITQDPVIFNDTIFNNVTFWAEKNPENIDHFNKAIKKASITDFILNQPHKEETMLGNNGINLSGGQKQRISIARELYKDIDILVLDEATSALDSETEREIQENIEALKGSYTILIVAHRLSTIKNADKIVLMNKGQIEEVGSYNYLLNNSEKFSRMVSFQEI